MKTFTTTLTLFFFFFSHFDLKSQNLCGYWAAYGYQCYKINPNGTTTFFTLPYELIYISQVQDTLVAMKIIGDDCVTAGFPTWKGLLVKGNPNFKASLFLGGPLQPNSSFQAVEINIYSNDSLFIWGIPATYKKLSCAQAQKLGANLSDTRYNCDCDNSQVCQLDLPNAFTPNNDGLNDTFSPITHCPLKTYEFWIYNRLGNLVFYTKDIKNEWKGTFLDAELASDVYAWRINATSQNGKVIRQSGEVLLLR